MGFNFQLGTRVRNPCRTCRAGEWLPHLPRGARAPAPRLLRLDAPCHCYRGPPISARTFEGSFSAVWVPTIARVGAFFHIFRDLQDSHSFAPLHTQIFVNFSFLFLQFFPPNFIIFCEFWINFTRVFEQILMKICRNFTGLKNASQNFGEISNFDELGVRGLPKKLK